MLFGVLLDVEGGTLHDRALNDDRGAGLGTGGLQVVLEALLGGAALVVAVLRRVHGQLEEFLVVGTEFPAVLLHLLAVVVHIVRIEGLDVAFEEFEALLGGEFLDFRSDRSGQLAAAAQDHAPDALVGEQAVARLALCFGHDVHQGDVLHILAERGHERRITDLRPYIFNLFEEFDHQVVERNFGFAVVAEVHVDGGVDALEVGHHGTHHAARKAAAHEQGGEVMVGRLDEVAQEVVDELLREGAGFHIGLHVDVLHLETGILEHGADGDHVGMDLAPGERFHGYVEHIDTGLGGLEHRSHGETGTCMAVILDDDVGVFLLDPRDDLADRPGTADTGHVLEADFLGAGFDEFLGQRGVILHGMDRGVRDAQGSLGNHAAFDGVLDRRDDVVGIVQAVEDTRDIDALGVLDLVHELAHIDRAGVHAEGIQTTVEHVGLDTRLMKRLRKGTDRLVRVLAIEELDLFERTAVRFHAVEAPHVDDYWSYFFELVDPGGVFAG